MKTIELDKVYKPETVEKKWYELWEKFDKFTSKPDPEKKPYSIVIPPPNITGSLHMGHALDNTIQDALIRFKRMQGFEALWIPGTDHAGIATQRVVEKELAKEGTTRWQIGREKFAERVWQWKEHYGGTIVNQLRRMGCSCDWHRERFTMDKGLTKAVREAFVRLYKEGRIFLGKRIVNWCIHCHTAISDLEVEYVENKGKLYHLRYPTEDGTDGITIATTRPETILADAAIAVNPKDPRYSHMVGKTVVLPLVGRKIPVIADYAVEIDFGTGALKITPAHDKNDSAIGQRHHLPVYVCIDDKGFMNEEAIHFKGMKREECRKAIVKELEEKGFLVKIDDYDMSVATCSRCHSVIEPYLSEQWFMNMEELAKPAIEMVKNGTTKFYPERYGRIYLNWLENIQDWCISRQLWWGHRIPVWICQDCGVRDAYIEDPGNVCPNCQGHNYLQEESVLDTWFSSGLWPFSTMGWPDKTPDLDYYYPTSVLATARDIIFLWVSRMMMMGLHFMGKVPFKDVYIHATILNKEGRRMSKSLGTGVDPLGLFDQYGADSTRFGLIAMTEQGQDIRFSEERIEMSRNFGNKIWNATRFVLRYIDKSRLHHKAEDFTLETWDRWILSRLNTTAAKVAEAYDCYQFDWASRHLYEFFWDNFCDWYIEITKPILNGDDENAKERTLWILELVIDRFLKLLHPLMPFLTEEINSFLPAGRGSEEDPSKMLISSAWPTADAALIDEKVEAQFGLVIDCIRALRNMRAEAALSPKQTAPFILEAAGDENLKVLEDNKDVISHLSTAQSISISKASGSQQDKCLSARVSDIDLYMPLEGLVDISAELNKLRKEKEKQEEMIMTLRKKCENPQFLERAKKEIVDKEMQRMTEAQEQLRKINERIKMFEA
ncbi:MAG: valine--tRNA ligase [Firmicutes bacterium]|nr:valine--tRNA ligase [Bacillota bacterium]